MLMVSFTGCFPLSRKGKTVCETYRRLNVFFELSKDTSNRHTRYVIVLVIEAK